jgi:hypothetical protein
MTIALSPDTVADSIAAINISGVTIKSIDTIPPTGNMIMPVLFPQPGGFITDIDVSRESFGTGGIAATNFMYTLHYVFLFAELGSGISQLDPYSPLIEKLKTVWETIITNDAVTGLVDMELAGVEGLGQVEDPSGNQFWGCLFSLRCLEFAQ